MIGAAYRHSTSLGIGQFTRARGSVYTRRESFTAVMFPAHHPVVAARMRRFNGGGVGVGGGGKYSILVSGVLAGVRVLPLILGIGPDTDTGIGIGTTLIIIIPHK